MPYLHWDQKTITDFSDDAVGEMYEKGYVFTRLGKGVMQQTRSVRIDLNKFELSSENRRILKKVSDLKLEEVGLPYADYNWQIGKLAKDFYDKKFGDGIMSAQKIKEILTDSNKNNFNLLLKFKSEGSRAIGYSICYSNSIIFHYSYPFYDLNNSNRDMGLGMMIMAIEGAKAKGLKYFYIGSLQRPTDTYKLQFSGLEWYDGAKWQTDIKEVKNILASAKM
jgi:arginyl-tRNA--protein-N-Asp/Glu arginylyltransferase